MAGPAFLGWKTGKPNLWIDQNGEYQQKIETLTFFDPEGRELIEQKCLELKLIVTQKIHRFPSLSYNAIVRKIDEKGNIAFGAKFSSCKYESLYLAIWILFNIPYEDEDNHSTFVVPGPTNNL